MKNQIQHDIASFWLWKLKGIGPSTKKLLIDTFGSAREIYQLSMEQIKNELQLSEGKWKVIEKGKELSLEKYVTEWNEAQSYEKTGKRIVFLEEKEYPQKLKELFDPPYALFLQGDLENNKPSVAIVGARTPSQYGISIGGEIAYELSKQGFVIVSGMARGIDGIAHENSLKAQGSTYAVLGCGLNQFYPKEHRQLQERISRQGCVISEYDWEVLPQAYHFPARNRLISGLSDAVIVVEAREKSGSFITADFALEQGKDVFVIPGRITDAMSRGCNMLIQQGGTIVLSVEELVKELKIMAKIKGKEEKISMERNLYLEKDEVLVYSCFDFYPKSLQQLQTESGLELIALLSAVMKLGELGLIKETLKNQYVKIHTGNVGI